jgi:hypothetical protein
MCSFCATHNGKYLISTIPFNILKNFYYNIFILFSDKNMRFRDVIICRSCTITWQSQDTNILFKL